MSGASPGRDTVTTREHVIIESRVIISSRAGKEANDVIKPPLNRRVVVNVDWPAQYIRFGNGAFLVTGLVVTGYSLGMVVVCMSNYVISCY